MITTDMLAAVPAAPQVPSDATAPAAPSNAPATPAATPSPDIWKQAAAKVAELVPEGTPLVTPAEEEKAKREGHWTEQPRDEQGKWTVNAAGERVQAEPAEGAAPVDGEPVADAPADADAPAEQPVVKLTLPNVRQPGGQGIEIEADDPEVADTVRALTNAYNRQEETKRRQEAIERRELDARELETMIRSAPEMLLDNMSEANRQRFVLHALVNHFDEFRPLVTSWWQDDMARREAALQWKEETQRTRGTYQRQLAETRQAHEIEKAVVGLIPWSATDEDAQDFRRVALMRLAEHAEAGQPITTQALPTILARDLTRFGWLPGTSPATESQSPSTPSLLKTEPAPASQTGARPAPDSTATVKSTTPAIAAQRKAAAAVTPGGGAAVGATQLPAPKTLAEASRLLRQIPAATWKGLR